MTRRGWTGSAIVTGAVLVAMLAAGLAAVVTSGAYGRSLVTTGLLLGLHATAWQLLLGGSGQLFLAVGGLASMAGYLLVVLVDDAGIGFTVAVLVAIGGASLIAGLLAWIGARRRLEPIMLGVVTLVVALAWHHGLLAVPGLTGGETGRVMASPPPVGATGSWSGLGLVGLVVVVAFAGRLALASSALGLAARAARDDAQVASMAGIAVVRTKVITAMIAGALIGIGGSLQVTVERFVNPSMFAFGHLDVRAIVAASLGVVLVVAAARVIGFDPGLAARLGPLVGAGLLVTLDELLRPLGQLRSAVYGAVLFVIVLAARSTFSRAAPLAD